MWFTPTEVNGNHHQKVFRRVKTPGIIKPNLPN